jgi:hypothetical protein
MKAHFYLRTVENIQALIRHKLVQTPELFQALGLKPRIKDTINKIKNNTKRILAISAAVPATPPKPKIPAITATTRKI